MGLVDDERLVGVQAPVAVGFRQQQAVRHHLDEGGGADRLLEAHREADGATERHVHFLGEARRRGAGGQAARLGVADQAAGTEAGTDARLG